MSIIAFNKAHFNDPYPLNSIKQKIKLRAYCPTPILKPQKRHMHMLLPKWLLFIHLSWLVFRFYLLLFLIFFSSLIFSLIDYFFFQFYIGLSWIHGDWSHDRTLVWDYQIKMRCVGEVAESCDVHNNHWPREHAIG